MKLFAWTNSSILKAQLTQSKETFNYEWKENQAIQGTF